MVPKPTKTKTFRKVSKLVQKANLKKKKTVETAAADSLPRNESTMAPVMKKPAALGNKSKHVGKGEESSPKKSKRAANSAGKGDEAAVEGAKSDAQIEKDLIADRTKELKGLYMQDLQNLVTNMGLEAGKKEDMIKSVLRAEAKLRAKERAQRDKIREVVVTKKAYFEALSAPELKEHCIASGIKGVLTKQERVEHLLAKWQNDDGVDKALAQLAHDARKQALIAMEPTALRKLCEKSSVDPYVKEVIVDRIIKCESAMGRFRTPSQQSEQKPIENVTSSDLVANLLASEAERKREKEVKQKQEEAAASKKKEFLSMSLEDLKKSLKKLGVEAPGKKQELVEVLVARSMEEEAAAGRKADLKAMALSDLKELLSSKGLDAGKGKKDEMIATLLASEAKHRGLLKAHATKVLEVAEKIKTELEERTANELKDICLSKGLKPGAGKKDHIQRLSEEAARDGQIDRIIEREARDCRIQTLNAMEKGDLVKLCDDLKVDALVKDIMIERIMAREIEVGMGYDADSAELAAKKSRKK